MKMLVHGIFTSECKCKIDKIYSNIIDDLVKIQNNLSQNLKFA